MIISKLCVFLRHLRALNQTRVLAVTLIYPINLNNHPPPTGSTCSVLNPSNLKDLGPAPICSDHAPYPTGPAPHTTSPSLAPPPPAQVILVGGGFLQQPRADTSRASSWCRVGGRASSSDVTSEKERVRHSRKRLCCCCCARTRRGSR